MRKYNKKPKTVEVSTVELDPSMGPISIVEVPDGLDITMAYGNCERSSITIYPHLAEVDGEKAVFMLQHLTGVSCPDGTASWIDGWLAKLAKAKYGE